MEISAYMPWLNSHLTTLENKTLCKGFADIYRDMLEYSIFG